MRAREALLACAVEGAPQPEVEAGSAALRWPVAPARRTGTVAQAANTANSAAVARQTGLSDAQLARYAVTALIEEAQLTPKPALVDRRGSGAHRDLDLAIMLRSAHALEPTFAALARVARRRGEPSALLRTELAQIGRAGEQDMLRATGGSNAHRGAIWIIGLLVAGASMRAPLHLRLHLRLHPRFRLPLAMPNIRTLRTSAHSQRRLPASRIASPPPPIVTANARGSFIRWAERAVRHKTVSRT